MKFWLACFLLLFIGAELLEWLSHWNRVDASGTWLILGGMGLAAASNLSHLSSYLSERHPPEAEESAKKASDGVTTTEENASTEVKSTVAERDTSKSASAEAQSIEAQSKEDSISFKVRLPWR